MTDEKEMYLLLIQHPEKGLEKIMNHYMSFVYTIVYGKLSNICSKQDIEECVSDIFYEIYKMKNIIDLEKGSLKSFLAVLSKRKAIDVYRKHRKDTVYMSIDEIDHDFFASNINVEKTVINNEAKNLLIDEIKALGEPDSQIIIRKYYFGQSTKIISKIMGIKGNTIDKKVSRALNKLKIALGGAL